MKFRLILTYIVIILLTVAVIRTYMLSAMENALYNDNKISLMTKINIIATDIVDVPEENIGFAMDEDIILLSIGNDNRIIVTNTDAVVIYDNASNIYANSEGKVRLSPMILSALYGESTYNKVENEDGVTTAASVPIMKNGEISGAIYIETSADEIHTMLLSTARSINYLTVLLCALAIILSFVFAGIFTSPIEKLIKKIKGQNVGHKMKIDVEA